MNKAKRITKLWKKFTTWKHRWAGIFLTNVHWNLLTLYHFGHGFAVIFHIIVIIRIRGFIIARVSIVTVALGECDVGLKQTHRALATFTLSTVDEVVINVDGELIIVGWHNISVFDILIDWLMSWLIWMWVCRAIVIANLWGSRRRCDFARRYVNVWFWRYKYWK